MRYGSVCSGIEAATVAWHPLDWQPAFFAEIEKFPSAVLAHRYPGVPNWGDITKFKEWPDAAIDVLVGGTPCQSFSVAGLRQGLADPRGNLCLTFLAIADRYRPQWLLWENVPGVLSSDGGRDFGAFLGGLGQLGYGWSYRVLDAQYVRVDGYERAVPQRRRRVFVVGYLGDYRRAAAVLFERESLQGHPAPRRQAGERVAAYSPSSIGGYSASDGSDGTLRSHGGDYGGGTETILTQAVANPLTARMHKGINTTMDEGQTMVAHALRADSFDAGEDGTGRGTPLVPIAFHHNAQAAQLPGPDRDTSISDSVTCSQQAAVAYSAMPMNSGKDFVVRETDVAQPSMAAGPSMGDQGGDYIQQNWAVRRLTPRECARLQGFPDDYLDITYNGKPAADGPRYKALGNSMACNVMRWIGRRIEMVDAL